MPRLSTYLPFDMKIFKCAKRKSFLSSLDFHSTGHFPLQDYHFSLLFVLCIQVLLTPHRMVWNYVELLGTLRSKLHTSTNDCKMETACAQKISEILVQNHCWHLLIFLFSDHSSLDKECISAFQLASPKRGRQFWQTLCLIQHRILNSLNRVTIFTKIPSHMSKFKYRTKMKYI